jgi:hypothetical protein
MEHKLGFVILVSTSNRQSGKRITVGYAKMNIIVTRTSFVIASIRSRIHCNIYVFRGNPSQTLSLEQSYHPTQPLKREQYNTKS